MDSAKPPDPVLTLRHVGLFTLRIFRDFNRNKGLLIAGALGYNTLLSVVPLLSLIVVALSSLLDETMLINAVRTQTLVILPGHAEMVTQAFASFLEKRAIIGGVGFAVMLLFSTIAFRMLQDAMKSVFRRSRRRRAHHWAIEALLPFAYVFFIGVSVLGLTGVLIAFEMLPDEGLMILGLHISTELAVPLVRVLAFLGLVILLSSFYWVMPQAQVSFRVAAIGGAVAATLWEAARSAMTWYFTNLSLVDAVYDSLSASIVVLVSLEVAAIILLLGAEIIAAIQRSAEHDLPWWQAPPDEDPEHRW